MFDEKFNRIQILRNCRNFNTDSLFKQIACITADQINMLQEIFKLNFNKIIAIDDSTYYTKNTEHIHSFQIIEDHYDLIISTLVLHHNNDIKNAVKNYYDHLNPNSALIISIFAESTLIELRRILEQTELKIRDGVSARVIPMISLKDATQLMQLNKLREIIVHKEKIVVNYSDFYEMLNHSRRLGQANCLVRRNKRYVGKDFFNYAKIEAINFFEQKTFFNTFEVIFMIGIK